MAFGNVLLYIAFTFNIYLLHTHA